MAQPNRNQPLQWRLVTISPLARDLQAFLIDRQAAGCSPRTVGGYGDELSRLTTWLEAHGVTDVANITPNHLRQFLLDLTNQGHNAGGVHRAYRATKTFLRWWERETEPTDWRNPIDRLKPPKLPDNPLPPIAVADLQAMLATCDKTLAGQRDRAALLCLLDTGCRAAEFLALDIGDVDLAAGVVTIRHGKGDKRRTVFLGAKSRRELGRYLRRRGNPSDGPLWCTLGGTRLTYAGLRQIVRRRAEAAGVAVPSLHSFRRANALLTLRGGGDLVSVSKLLGHSDLGVTRRYLKLEISDLAETHRKAGPVDRML